jgi:hypothetical protein
MQYFDSLPKLYTITPRGTSVLTNIMARASIIQSVLNNPLLYYTYDIQDSDTPEIVAHKYYGSSYYYWVLMYTNQLTDPLWDWPLSRRNFDAYIEQKYTQFDPYTTTHHYEKIITQVDAGTNTTTENIVNISLIDYIVLQETTTTYSLPTGQVTVSVTKKAVSYYEYELNLNESKRTIKILNKSYLGQFEDELKRLML